MLSLNIKHISLESLIYLEKSTIEVAPQIIVYDKYGRGFFIAVDTIPEKEKLPSDIRDLIDFARKFDCSWIMLDSDTLINCGLPAYDLT